MSKAHFIGRDDGLVTITCELRRLEIHEVEVSMKFGDSEVIQCI
jgi:hypothetical protein